MLDTHSIEEQLRSVAGPENLRPATPGDTVCGVLPQFIAEPENEQQLAAILSAANDAGIAVIPRGSGSKLDWGNPPSRAELILSTARLNQILEHAWADQTVTVEVGCALQSLQNALAKHGQRLACDSLWPENATVGGLLSTNDSGALRLRFGALRDLIIGVTLALPDGTLASSGGKVVKNVAGYDLPKLTTGAFGTLGVITRAVFRLHPLPRAARTLSFAARDFLTMQAHILGIQDSKLAHTALQIRRSAGSQPQADILLEATDAGLDAQESHLRELLGSTTIESSTELVWGARQELWSPADDALVAKISILPAQLEETAACLQSACSSPPLDWKMVAQATGIATLRIQGEAARLSTAIQQLRAEVQAREGSLVVLRRPSELFSLDAWGDAGDALPLMHALKHQLDPKNTLNPGRFVGGI
jgi:glycolate oxidase FAD binding subunit